jgi:RNA polymerase sigma factor (sigma-70 family)
MIDPREKERLFEKIITENDWWLGVIARSNAPINSCEDLEQEIRIAFWKSFNSYSGDIPNLEKRFFSVAINTAKQFTRKNSRMRKREEVVYPNPVLVEQDRDLAKIIEEFTEKLGELDRKVFNMYLDALSYADMSAALDIAEANLRKRVSRIKEQLKTQYEDY